MPLEQLTYGQIKDLHKSLGAKNPQLAELSLPEFAQLAAKTTGPGVFEAGFTDNWVKRASDVVDRVFKPIGEAVTAPVMKGGAEALGLAPKYVDFAEELGTSMPRAFAEVGLMFVPGGQASFAARLGARSVGMLSSGAATYTATDSPAAGAVGAAVLRALPPMIRYPEKWAMEAVRRSSLWKDLSLGAAQAGEKVVRVPGSSSALMKATERGVEFGARNLGAALNQEAAIQGVSLAMGQGVRGLDDMHVAELVGGMMPFTLLEAIGVVRPQFRTEPGSRMRTVQQAEQSQAMREVMNFQETSMKEAKARLEKAEGDQVQKVLDSFESAKAKQQAAVEYKDVRSAVLDRLHQGVAFDEAGVRGAESSLSRGEITRAYLKELTDRAVLRQQEDGTYVGTGKVDVGGIVTRHTQPAVTETQVNAMRIRQRTGREAEMPLPPEGVKVRLGEKLMKFDPEAPLVKSLDLVLSYGETPVKPFDPMPKAEKRPPVPHVTETPPVPYRAKELGDVRDAESAVDYLKQAYKEARDEFKKGYAKYETIATEHHQVFKGALLRVGETGPVKEIPIPNSEAKALEVAGEATDQVRYTRKEGGTEYAEVRTITEGERRALGREVKGREWFEERAQAAKVEWQKGEAELVNTFAAKKAEVEAKLGVEGTRQMQELLVGGYAKKYREAGWGETALGKEETAWQRKMNVLEQLKGLTKDPVLKAELEGAKLGQETANVKLTTLEEIAVMQREADTLRGAVARHKNPEVQHTASVLERLYYERIQDIANRMAQGEAYPGSTLPNAFAVATARHVKHLTDLVNEVQSAYLEAAAVKWEAQQRVYEGLNPKQAMEDAPVTVPEDQARRAKITRTMEERLFEQLSEMQTNPKLAELWEGMEVAIYKSTRTKESGQQGTIAELATPAAQYMIYERAAMLMQGYLDMEAGLATPFAEMWVGTKNSMKQKDGPDPSKVGNVMRHGLSRMLSTTTPEGAFVRSRGTLYEGGPKTIPLEIMDYMDQVNWTGDEFVVEPVSAYVDEGVLAKITAEAEGHFVKVEEGTVASEVQGAVLEALKTLRFKEGKLKEMTFAEIKFAGQLIDGARTRKLEGVQREKVGMAEKLEKTREVLTRLEDFGFEFGLTADGSLTLRPQVKIRTGQIHAARLRVLRYIGIESEGLKKAEAKYREAVWKGTDEALFSAIQEAHPSWGRDAVLLEAKKQSGEVAALAEWQRYAKDEFRLWYTDAPKRKSPVTWVLEAAMGEALGEAQKYTRVDYAVIERSATIMDREVATSVLNTEPRAEQTAQAFRAAVRENYAKAFEQLGYDMEARNIMGDVAARVASVFDETLRGTKLATLVSDSLLGLAVTSKGNKTAVIATVMLNSPWFRNLPHQSQKVFKLMHVLAHEAGHVLHLRGLEGFLGENTKALMEQVNRTVETLAPAERGAVLGQLYDAMVPVERRKGMYGDTSNWSEVAARNPGEFVAEYIGFRALGIARAASSTGLRFNMGFLHGPDYLAQFDRALYTTMKDIITVYRKADPATLPFGKNRKLGVEMLASMDEALDKVMAGQKRVDDLAVQLQRLVEETPSQYAEQVGVGRLEMAVDDLTRWGSTVPSDTAKTTINYASTLLGRDHASLVDKHYGVRVGWLSNTFMLPALLTKMFQHLRDPVDMVFRFRPIANTLAHKIALPLLRVTKLGPLSIGSKLDTKLTGLKVISNHPKLKDAVSHLWLAQAADGDGRVFSVEEIRTFLKERGVTDEKQVQAAIDFEMNARKVAVNERQAILDQTKLTAMSKFALRYMLVDKELTMKEAKLRAAPDFEMVWKAAFDEDVQAAASFELALPQIESSAKRQAHQDLYNYAKIVADFAKRTEGAEWYRPEIRLGKHMVVWFDTVQEKHGSAAFDTEAQVERKLQQLAADPKVKNVKAWNKHDKADATRGLNPDFLKTLQEIEQSAFMKEQMVAGWDAEMMKEFGYEPLAASMRRVEEMSTSRYFRPRKLAPGREDIDMVKGFLLHITSLSTALAKDYTKAEIALALSDPTIRDQPTMLKMARDHFNTVLNPSAKEWSGMKKLNFAYFMGANLSSMMIEPTQQFIATAPTLTRDSGSVVEGYRSLANAAKLFGTAALAKVKGKKGDAAARISTVDKQMAELLVLARDRQVLDFGVHQEFYAAADEGLLNLNTVVQGGTLGEKAGWLGRAAFNTYFDVVRTIYGQMPKMNNMIAFIAAADLARRHGVFVDGKLTKLTDTEALYNYAADTTRATQYGGGLAARPIGMFANAGKFQGVLGLSYSLMSFTFGIFSHFARLTLDSIDARGRLNPKERLAARKALGQSLMSQVAFAGALGLPMAGAMLTLLEQLFPELEARKAVTEFVRKLAGEEEDEDDGGWLTDLALRGAPFTFGGIDMSSRLDLSNVLGLSPYDGFRLANLLGPTGGIVENATRALGQASQGLVGDAAETLLPTAYKNTVKLWRDGWEVKDSKGRKLLEPTIEEIVMQMVGFRPARLTKVRDAQKTLERGEQIAGQRGARFHRDMADLLLQGETERVREQVFARAEKEEGYSAIAGMQAVVEAALDRMGLWDMARSGTATNASERHRAARQAGVPRQGEAERLVTKKRLGAGLGLPGAGRVSRAEAMRATIIDSLMTANPFMSRQEAVAIAEGRPW